MAEIGPLRATISRGALEANARRGAAQAGTDAVADLRRDAFGHGIETVASALAAAGVRLARVDEPGTAAGVTETDASPTLDSRTLYGLPGGDGAPVMRLAGSVLSLKRLLAGEGVSYNHTHIAERDTRIALVSGGFGQGVARGLGNRVSVEIGGARHPVVGRVAMDVCVVDVGDAPVEPGDEVVYFGGEGPARDALEEWEDATGLTAAELVCALGLRVRREAVA
ncbi:MAG: alanine racemase C-terminal domain-containing protein [Microbacterium sp.]|uniref:alanine racemase C-terminal domain-containing protein n=1 Tax=Microbacterium sp. TaxID=51671 RepID=UPI0039E4F1FD